MKSDKSKGKFREAFTKEKVIRFLDKQGFYIVLFVCIAIIGTTAYMTSGKNGKPQELADKDKVIEEQGPKPDNLDVAEGVHGDKINIKVIDSKLEPGKTEDDKAKDENSKGENTKDDNVKGNKVGDTKEKGDKSKDEKVQETLASNTPKDKEGAKGQDAPKKQEETPKKSSSTTAMIYPIQGNVLKGHVMDELVYSNTLKEWTTHSGVDIEAFIGAEVKAAMGGTVEEIIEDSLMGICITLDHGNGLKTYYANLSTGNMVTVGQKVDKGQIISGVGRTASAEILDDPHLHFEVRQDGNTVDPKKYIK